MSVEVLKLREGITLKQLQDVLARYVAVKGCPACGLNGFDLRFEIDPAIRYRDLIKELDGVLTGIEVRAFDADQIGARAVVAAGAAGAAHVANGAIGH